MPSERCLAEKEIFLQALEVSADQIPAYLAEACCGDDALRAKVEVLLEVHQRAETEDFLGEKSLGPIPIPPQIDNFGDFINITYLGHGGMGVVYKAFDTTFKKDVALKIPRPDLALHDDLFMRDPQNIVRLRHHNIVQVYKVGKLNGRPWFTMLLIEGDNIDKYVASTKRDPRVAATLMVKVARAVHHAHQRGILHRDLKPGNILLDNEGEPLVTDFGLATKAVMPDAALSDAAAILASRTFQGVVGTPAYMSPEQAADDPPMEVTTLSDVYGLGGVLYSLLTGRAPFEGDTVEKILRPDGLAGPSDAMTEPFEGDTVEKILRQVRDPVVKPPPPHTLNPHVDHNMQAICLKGLNKDPAHRYRSAEGLARDLERWLAHEELEARPLPIIHPERTWRWCRRNPGWAALTGATVVLLILSAVLANLGAYYMESKALEASGESNTRAAEMVADNVLWLMRDLSHSVVETAESEQVRQLLRRTKLAGNREELESFFKQNEGRKLKRWVEDQFTQCNKHLIERDIPPFATFYFLNEHGMLVTHEATSWVACDPTGKRYEGRDYFKGSHKHFDDGRHGMKAVHISRVFHSHSDKYFKFAIAVPVIDDDRKFLGVVSASIPIHRTLGLSSKGLHHSNQQTMLVGGVDRNPATVGHRDVLTYDYHVLLHDAYKDSDELRKKQLPFTPRSSWPQRSFELPELIARQEKPIDYDSNSQDPLAGIDQNYQGRWLTGSARVGNTELVVIVQQRYDEAIGRPIALAKTFVWSGWCALAISFGFAATVTVFRARSKRFAA